MNIPNYEDYAAWMTEEQYFELVSFWAVELNGRSKEQIEDLIRHVLMFEGDMETRH